MEHKDALPFSEPVDAIASGAVDYYDVIKNPMDLGTVKQNVEKGRYRGGWEFAQDMRLI